MKRSGREFWPVEVARRQTGPQQAKLADSAAADPLAILVEDARVDMGEGIANRYLAG